MRRECGSVTRWTALYSTVLRAESTSSRAVKFLVGSWRNVKRREGKERATERGTYVIRVTYMVLCRSDSMKLFGVAPGGVLGVTFSKEKRVRVLQARHPPLGSSTVLRTAVCSLSRTQYSDRPQYLYLGVIRLVMSCHRRKYCQPVVCS